MQVRKIFGAAFAVLALASAVPSASAATAPDPTKSYLVDCGGNLKIKPKQIVFACGDGNTFIKGITWSTWDMNGAVGKGTLVTNVCLPTCGANNILTYKKVKITLGGLASEGALNVFSQVEGAFKSDGGPAMSSRATWVIDNPVKS